MKPSIVTGTFDATGQGYELSCGHSGINKSYRGRYSLGDEVQCAECADVKDVQVNILNKLKLEVQKIRRLTTNIWTIARLDDVLHRIKMMTKELTK